MLVRIIALTITCLATQLCAELTKPVEILKRYCLDCHDADVQKGKIRLDNIERLTQEQRLSLFNKMQEQLFFKEMPPKKKRQPTASERQILSKAVSVFLDKYDASTLKDKLRYPDYGNYIDHNLLFSSKSSQKAYTPARRWLVSPQIFQERVADIFQLKGRDRLRKFYGVTNPFVLNENSGVRYYDNSTLSGGHLLVMLTNAEWISQKQILAAKYKGVHPREIKFENLRDKWLPRTAPEEFVKIVTSSKTPSKSILEDAIQKQFHLVLRRPATASEFSKYYDLTSKAIKLTDNTEGLKQMLKAVILESDFLYRLEFGEKSKDSSGRKKLTGHEAAFALSYALGDRSPDEKLLKAAEEGKLSSPKDYEREVRRLLDDKNYYSGAIDPTVTGKKVRSQITSHPKLVRFFREFFGYPSAMKVFKDNMRSDGTYNNPGRGSAGTAGKLVNEADKIVDHILKEDIDVFNKLLTTDEYFVHEARNIDQGKKFVKKWTEFYEKYKNVNWKKEEERILAENKKMVASSKAGGHANRLDRVMNYLDNTLGKKKGFPAGFPWAHGNPYTARYSMLYNLPPLPNPPYDQEEYWDYPLEQPFKIANRKGILTHPAWLVAHSHNAETDPVKRGRWIREKLLAGRVPDIPITVDAQVPEDPHKTLRERFDEVTGQSECWRCHQYMNPLGYPFEIYDDFGRFRKAESLEHEENIVKKSTSKHRAPVYKTRAVDSSGYLSGTGDKRLDGKVKDALDMIDRLAKSTRVRQSFIRHAFRYFMGRNEMLSDAQTLINADQAYVKSKGSFKAVVVSLLSSDSFIYRK